MERPDNKNIEPQALVEAALWADSCFVCDDEDASVGNDSLNLLIDTLMENSPNLFSMSAETPTHTTSLDDKQETIYSTSQASSSTKLPVSDDLDPIEEDTNDTAHYDFVHEKTNDPTRIRYRGEEYAIFEGSEQMDNDLDLEVPTDFLVDIESIENIFKVWDLRVSSEDDDDEEDQLTLNLKEALGESYLTRTAEKIDEDSITSLNADQLNDIVNDLIALSLSPEQQQSIEL